MCCCFWQLQVLRVLNGPLWQSEWRWRSVLRDMLRQVRQQVPLQRLAAQLPAASLHMCMQSTVCIMHAACTAK